MSRARTLGAVGAMTLASSWALAQKPHPQLPYYDVPAFCENYNAGQSAATKQACIEQQYGYQRSITDLWLGASPRAREACSGSHAQHDYRLLFTCLTERMTER